MEARRSRVPVRSRGVCIEARPECGSALKARRFGVREGVRDGVCEAALVGDPMGLESMMVCLEISMVEGEMTVQMLDDGYEV